MVADCSILGNEIDAVLDRRCIDQPISGIGREGGGQTDGGIRHRRGYADGAQL